ncbi:virion [Vibrio phage R01]|nr:virion [Vibrio phage R01]
MAYQQGTANGYKDFLAKLRTFALANGWTQKRSLTPSDGEHELILQSTGDSGQDSITLAWKTRTDTAADSFNLLCKASNTFTDTPFESLVNANSPTVVYLWDGTINYHFMVNKERIMFACVVSSTSQYYYGGNMRTYTSRGHWVSPLCCFGVGTDAAGRWSGTGDNYSGWQYVRGTKPVPVFNEQKTWVKMSYIHPFMGHPQRFPNWVAYENGDRALLQSIVKIDGHAVVGELIGVYGSGGLGLSNMQELSHSNGKKYLVVQNVYRAGGGDYLIMEKA